MRKLVCLSAGWFEYAIAETPEPGKADALIRIGRVGICGTGRHAFEGTQPYFTYPRILGYELAGELVHFGLQKEEVSFSHPEFHKREGTLMSSRNANRQDFEHVIASIKSGKIEPANYITHRVRFEDVKSEFAEFCESKKWCHKGDD